MRKVRSGIHFELSADSPQAMRELFELCMAKTNELHDGTLVGGKAAGAGMVYVFGEECPDCDGRGWNKPEAKHLGVVTCTICNGKKQVQPIWVQS
jgi:hypothetical protein